MHACASRGSAYELRFQSLFGEGSAQAFPCAAAGRVELERLSERARSNCLRALAAVGRDFATPALLPVLLHRGL
ncbi:MAG: hypothetical protein KIT17_05300 [Rubrivivax sp.]|nr:hypothetical protein [Rubrivivax sp.]